ncbi:Fe-S cluster assembly protein HesB [Bifidobacterium primatium]|uniref:Fe-S cluster assembly protein HesB n=2 Tax=Bifidobacterium TaxID=1678 RepID=A0A2M9H7A4_9BIFI|nr:MULTISPECIES: MurR/RpiR family transcriptional regulator [Bifidobacterium]NEG95703.1 SIS domain-containing protein [Bifidobacterium sp. SMB2]NEH11130.1 SIS domain-containing protein [Bifidobacterium saimiriisciurei]PJM72689.1 Fe-S cluster assembly protein HesB [Bifidobacterium primatium]
MGVPVDIRQRISNIYSALRPAEKSVASYIRDHYDEIASLTVSELADAASVSQPTVIRFARKLGFNGYREMRYVLRHPTDNAQSFDPLEGFDLHPWDSIDDVPARAAAGAKSMLDDMLDSLSLKEFHKAVNALGKARVIDIYGVENSMVPANDLLTKLTYLGLQCRMHTDAYMQQISAGHLTDEDAAVAFSYSGSSDDTVKALRLARNQGAKTIAVTNSSGTPLANWADICLCAGHGERTIYGNAIFSRVSHVAIVDMLYMGLILSNYTRYSSALDDSGRYIRDRVFHG